VQPDGRLAVDTGHRDDLVQELVFLGPGRGLIPLPLHAGILAQTRSRHGAFLQRIGNRDF
jgi:hypothetical protein